MQLTVCGLLLFLRKTILFKNILYYETLYKCNMVPLRLPPQSPVNNDISATNNHRGLVVRMDFSAASGWLSSKA